VRQRDPRKLLPENRPLPARVKIVHVAEQGYADDGSVTTRQEAEVTVPRDALDRLWIPENLENRARTSWAFLIRISLGGFGRWLYKQTQLRIHVIVTHAFLRSLGNLELEQSQVGSLRLAPPEQQPVP
jgi:hypothetical protein